MVANPKELTADGKPLPYTAAWHHRHLYNPRSVSEDSNMPAYRFLYEKRRITGVASSEAINFAGDSREEPEIGWEIVPSYDAKCLVAYLMTHSERIDAISRGAETAEQQRRLLAEGASRFFGDDRQRTLVFGIRAEIFRLAADGIHSTPKEGRAGRG